MPMRKSSEEKLLDAADELLFTRGIESTPVDAVLARAGVSAATLYRGYRSKEALVAAALERRHTRWIDEWDAAIDAAADDEQRLLAVFDALETFRCRPDGARWCAFLGTAAEYSNPTTEVADAVARDTDALRRRLRERSERLDCVDPGTLAEELLLVVTGELAMRLRRGDNSPSVGRQIASTLIRAGRDQT